MSASNVKVQTILEKTFVSAINQLTSSESPDLISDLYVQVDAETGELTIFDDAENLLEKIVIFDWVNSPDEEQAFYTNKVFPVVKSALNTLASKEVFEAPVFTRPFAVSLTDEEFIVVEELLFIDDDMFRLDDPLLKDLDADLDQFLNDLLSDVE
ncbi:MAG: hypothetical protein LIP04_13195 [Tannerellaceae bacterium]|nr:hypothetical protein [Tannerellaceae bacterium]